MANAAPVVTLPAFHAHEWAISDFGMSVKTNFEVAHGGSVEWIEISAIEPRGPAKSAGLAVGDRILAIDRELVTKLGREGLLDALFKRKSGDHIRILITNRREALPRFVEVVARRP